MTDPLGLTPEQRVRSNLFGWMSKTLPGQELGRERSLAPVPPPVDRSEVIEFLHAQCSAEDTLLSRAVAAATDYMYGDDEDGDVPLTIAQAYAGVAGWKPEWTIT